jgi:hypothetical protein
MSNLPSGEYKVVLLKAKRSRNKMLTEYDFVLVDSGERESAIGFLKDFSRISANSGLKMVKESTTFQFIQDKDPAPVMLLELQYSPERGSSRVVSSHVTAERAACDVRALATLTDFSTF